MADIRIIPSTGLVNVTGSINFKGTGGSTMLFITGSSGNVGIGTTNPGHKLDVSGSVRLGGTEAQALPIKMGWDANAVYMGGPNNNTINTGYDTNSDYNLHINYVGYQGSTTRYRNLVINDGKQALIAHFDGASRYIGIGTSSPNAPLHIVKDLGTSVSAVARLRGSNSTARTTRLQFEDYNGTIADGLIDFIIPTGGSSTGARLDVGVDSAIMSLVKGGNVGVGTTSPSYKLDVSGQIRVNNGVGNGSGQALIVGGSGDVTLTDGGSLFFGAYDYGGSTYIRGYDGGDIMYFYSNGTNMGYFRSDRAYFAVNTGIGTSSPSTRLHVSGGDAILRNAYIGEVPTYGAANSQFSHISRAGAGEYSFLSDSVGETYVNAKTGYNIYFRNNNNNLAIITSTGNVGIGTVSPTQLLEGYTSTNGDISIQITNPSTGASATAQFFASNGTNRTQFFHTGTSYNGTGVLASAAGLGGIYNNTAQGIALLASSAAGPIKFATTTSNTERMRIASDGNVGIGSTSPGKTLDVVGAIRASTAVSASAGIHIKSDGSADTSWDALTFRGTTEWGDASAYGVLGGDASEGIMLRRPHIVWSSVQSDAAIRLGRSGGSSGGDWFGVGVAASNVFFIRRSITTNSVLEVDTNGNMALGAGSDYLYVRQGGNVGVGTTNPSNKFQVVGGVTATSFTGSLLGNATSASFASTAPYSGLTGTVPTWNQNTTGTADYATYLYRRDIRAIAPNDETSGTARFGFTSWGNNNTSPYADFLHLRSYTDASGGSDNLVMFLKSGIGMRIWQQSWNSGTDYSSYKDVAFTDSNITGNAATATTASFATTAATAATATSATSATTATTATNVAWTGVTAGRRTNYDLGFEAPSTGYAGFSFTTPGGAAENAGYFLIRGGADNDVYTQNGITLVADTGWLTLAQRTTAGKGVRIMTGTTSTERLTVLQGGSIGINTTSPTSLLHVYDNADVWHTRIGGASGELRIGGQTASGAVIQAYTPAGSVRDLYIQRDGGSVGIGTTSPTAPLQINGAGGDGAPSLRITSAASDTFNWATDARYANLATGETTIYLIGKANSQYNQAYFGYRHVSDGSASNMLTLGMYASDYLVNIIGNGNVGIGTTAPDGRLDVQASNSGVHLARVWNTNTAGTGASVLRIANSGNNNNGNRIEFTDQQYYTATISGDRTQGIVFRTSATGGDPIAIDERMRITPGGLVGIGVTSPINGSKFEVRGSGVWDGGVITLTNTGTGGRSWSIFSTNNSFSQGGDRLLIYNTTAGTNAMVIDSSNNVGIGTTNPAYKLEVNGDIRANGGTAYYGLSGYSYISYSGTDGYYRANGVHYFEGTSGFKGAWNASGNLGVGTTGPIAKLHVSGSSGSLAFNVEGSQGQLFSVTDSLSGSLMSVNDISGLPILEVFSDDRVIGGKFGSNALSISGSNVGIGAYNPARKLDVYDAASQIVAQFSSSNATSVRIKFSDANTGAENVNIGAIGTRMALWTNNTERVSILSGGNVGINTTSPGAQLEVYKASDAFISVRTGGGSYSYLQLATPSSDNGYIIKNTATGNSALDKSLYLWNGTGPIQFVPNGTIGNAVTIDTSGNIGIGSTSPAFKLDVNGGIRTLTGYIQGANSSADITIDGNTGTLLRYGTQKILLNSSNAILYTADAIRLFIDNAGLVGIGTSSPTHLLHVSGGGIRIQGTGPVNSLRLDDTGGTSRNAMYVSSSNYLVIDNINYTGLQLVHTGSAPQANDFQGTINQFYGTDERIYLAEPTNWLAIRINTTNYVIPMYLA